MLAADNASLITAYAAFGIIGYLIVAFGYYGVFKKAGQPAWGAFVPFVNIYFILKIVGRPGWWVFLIIFLPCIGWILLLFVTWELVKSFGHGFLMFLGVILLPIIFLYVLGYGSSEYQGPAAA